MSSECKLLFWRLEIMLQLQCAAKLWELEEEWLVLHACAQGWVCASPGSRRVLCCAEAESMCFPFGVAVNCFPTQLAQCRMFVD